MADKKYNVIISDRAKRELGTSIRFITQVSKEAAAVKKKELIAAMRSPEHMPQRFPFLMKPAFLPTNITKCMWKIGTLYFIRYRTTLFM